MRRAKEENEEYETGSRKTWRGHWDQKNKRCETNAVSICSSVCKFSVFMEYLETCYNTLEKMCSVQPEHTEYCDPQCCVLDLHSRLRFWSKCCHIWPPHPFSCRYVHKLLTEDCTWERRDRSRSLKVHVTVIGPGCWATLVPYCNYTTREVESLTSTPWTLKGMMELPDQPPYLDQTSVLPDSTPLSVLFHIPLGHLVPF